MLFSSVKTLLSVSIFASGLFFAQHLIISSDVQAKSVGKSGLALPRFVSIKAKKVNMRVGPGVDYKVDWMYTKVGLPLEILQEYDNWRKVRDSEGSEGWISKSLLSGKRTAIVAPWKRGETNGLISMKTGPSGDATIVARLEPGLVVKIDKCEKSWCEVEVESMKGFAPQDQLWGVYPDESVE